MKFFKFGVGIKWGGVGMKCEIFQIWSGYKMGWSGYEMGEGMKYVIFRFRLIFSTRRKV